MTVTPCVLDITSRSLGMRIVGPSRDVSPELRMRVLLHPLQFSMLAVYCPVLPAGNQACPGLRTFTFSRKTLPVWPGRQPYIKCFGITRLHYTDQCHPTLRPYKLLHMPIHWALRARRKLAPSLRGSESNSGLRNERTVALSIWPPLHRPVFILLAVNFQKGCN